MDQLGWSSVQIDLPPTMVISEGLPGRYTAVQMHLHWGGWDLEASGAEHTVDGIRYMAEVLHNRSIIHVYICMMGSISSILVVVDHGMTFKCGVLLKHV